MVIFSGSKNMALFKKVNPRRTQLRKNIVGDKFSRLKFLTDADIVISIAFLTGFFVLCVPLLSFRITGEQERVSDVISRRLYPDIVPIAIVVLLICIGVGFYIGNFQKRILRNHIRSSVLAALFLCFLFIAKLGRLLNEEHYWVVGSAVTIAIILSMSYDRRFALGMGLTYCVLASFIGGGRADVILLFTMFAGVITCCFSLNEIRTRMKLLEVGAVAAAVVFISAAAFHFLNHDESASDIVRTAASYAVITFLVGLLIQGLLPVIEKYFGISTSMTLLDYSDANQPLLKRLAMEAPGTYSHSLLVGTIAEAAAEAIDRNGLLCRVGAYYHDIGKINKPGYFAENEMGSVSRHKELSPAMSQLVIIGHVKDGIEMAREYGLPVVLRQFIEAHHGTTLIEYFYNEAKKKSLSKQPAPSESEFRYSGPKPRTKEAAIVMLADAVESAVRSMGEVSAGKIESVVHNIAMRRLQDGQFDECNLSLHELSRVEASMSMTLTAHYHARIAYPKPPDEPVQEDINKS